MAKAPPILGFALVLVALALPPTWLELAKIAAAFGAATLFYAMGGPHEIPEEI